MNCHSLIHWKGYPQSRFPHIRFGPKRHSSRSSHASSSMRRTRKLRKLKKSRLHNQVQEELFGWRSPSLDEDNKSGLLGPEPVLKIIPSSLVHTRDGAEEIPSPVSIGEANGSLRPAAPTRGYAPLTRAVFFTVQPPNTSDVAKRRVYDPRICPRRLLQRTNTANTAVGSPCVRSVVRGLTPPVSRSPSQRRTLRRFTRELELHLKAVENLPKKSLVPSPSITTIHTVEDLKPYHKQLLSAGLAVTSAEQRRKLSLSAKQKPLSRHKLEKCEKLANISTKRVLRKPIIDLSMMDGSHKSYPSSITLSTDHTVLGWTPPHEQPDLKPALQPMKDLSQILPEDVLYPSSPTRKTTFKQSADALNSSPTRPAPRPGQPSPRNSLPWLQKQTKVVSASSTSIETPKNVSSQAEIAKLRADLVKPLVSSDVSTHYLLPCVKRRSSASLAVNPTKNLRDSCLSIDGNPTVYAHKATQTSPTASSANDHCGSYQDASSGQSSVACSLCPHRERSYHVEESSPSPVFMVCPECQTRRPSGIAKADKSEVVCPLCSTKQQPSYAVNRKRRMVACSLCSTRRPSITNIDQSKMKCPWCLLFQWPPPEICNVLCSYCLALQPSTSAEKENSGSTQLQEENSQGGPSRTKQKQNVTTLLYEVASSARVLDPTKRLSPTISKAKSFSTKSSKPSRKEYLTAKMQTPLPPIPKEMANSQKGADSRNASVSSFSTLGFSQSPTKISYLAVLRGLQVAINAACDEDIDHWVSEVTGKKVRDFLVDLSILGGISGGHLAEVARRAAE